MKLKSFEPLTTSDHVRAHLIHEAIQFASVMANETNHNAPLLLGPAINMVITAYAAGKFTISGPDENGQYYRRWEALPFFPSDDEEHFGDDEGEES